MAIVVGTNAFHDGCLAIAVAHATEHHSGLRGERSAEEVVGRLRGLCRDRTHLHIGRAQRLGTREDVVDLTRIVVGTLVVEGVDAIQVVARLLGGELIAVGRACLVEFNLLEGFPASAVDVHFDEHRVEKLRIALRPGNRTFRTLCVVLHRQPRRRLHGRRAGNEFVFRHVAGTGVHRYEILACGRELTILIDTRRVAFAVPIGIALHAVHLVQTSPDAGHRLFVLCFGDTVGKSTVAVPRCSPHELRNPDGTF